MLREPSQTTGLSVREARTIASELDEISENLLSPLYEAKGKPRAGETGAGGARGGDGSDGAAAGSAFNPDVDAAARAAIAAKKAGGESPTQGRDPGPKSPMERDPDTRFAAMDALDEPLSQIAAEKAAAGMRGSASLALTEAELAARRAAVADLFDSRHQYVDAGAAAAGDEGADEEASVRIKRRRVHSQKPVAARDAADGGAAEDEWFVDEAHNVPQSFTRTLTRGAAAAAAADATLPRWMRGIETAEKRQMGIDVEDDTVHVDAGASVTQMILDRTIDAIRGERGRNLVVIDVRQKCDHADYIVIVEGRSSKQIHSMIDAVRRSVRHVLPRDTSLPDNLAIQGEDSEDWKLLDLGGVMVNCFTADARAFYDLEELWINMDPSRLNVDFAMEPDELRDSLATRIRSRDVFMLMALWMERHPGRTPAAATPGARGAAPSLGTPQSVRPTGCVLVDPRDRVVALESTGESHAIVRAILRCPHDPRGCDIYVSRFPCAMCAKFMVQAGIRKIYYFPAQEWEMDWHAAKRLRKPSTFAVMVAEKREFNIRSVQRLISNNPIGMSLYIPQWDHSGLDEDDDKDDGGDATVATSHLSGGGGGSYSGDVEISDADENGGVDATGAAAERLDWALDMSIASTPALSMRWATIVAKFRRTIRALELLHGRYTHATIRRSVAGPHSAAAVAAVAAGGAHTNHDRSSSETMTDAYRAALVRHAMVLAHIAAKRTDDPKVGVGSVLVDPCGRYDSVGWNGYPKKAAHLDYPQAGADDSVEDEELKYDYILHAEQNTLLWRNPPGGRLAPGAMIVSTKMPCDECSPVMADCGVSCVVSVPQAAKSIHDPARLRGLTYDKLAALIPDRWVFEVAV
nr:Cytidine and dCMP deaminase domain-containing protein 1 [Polyrhizophydium stewartii]